MKYRTRIIRSISMSILVGMLALNACKPGPIIPTSLPTETAFTPEITSTPTEILPSPTSTLEDSGLEVIDDGSPLPPKLVEQTPQGGEELQLDGEIVLVFDQPMDVGETAAALQVTDSGGAKVEGEVTWSDPRSLHFRALKTMQPGTVYYVNLSNQAINENGIALIDPINFQFLTTGNLQVSQVFPADGSKDVASNAVITVIFNRPVAPLVIAEERADLPDPLVISPSISGEGEWVNTSVYAFRPERTYKGGITYTVKVKAGLEDSSGASILSEDYTWQFSTTMPGIDSLALSNGRVNPEDNFRNFLLDDYFTFKFLQPMDQASTETSLTLTGHNGEKELLTTEWNKDSTTVVITPTRRLAIGASYTLNLSSMAQSADGTALGEGLTWNFTTIPLPTIASISPKNGSTQTNFDSQLLIQFVSPMRIDTVEDRIDITPSPEEEFQWWYSDYSWNISAYFLEPSTRYEVRILPGMEDIYGNQMKEGFVYHFTTAAYQPSGSLLMPYETSIVRADGPPGVQEFYADYTNIKSVSFEMYRLTADQYMTFLNGGAYTHSYVPSDASLVWRTEERNQAKLNQQVTKSYLPVTTEGEPIPPGFYFLSMDSPQIESSEFYVDQRLVIVANSNLTFKTSSTDGLVWLTDLESGKPVSDAHVSIYDEKIREIGQGKTDENGLLFMDLPTPEDPYSDRFAIVDDGKSFAFASGKWGSGVSLWDYGIWSSYYAPANQPTAYIYTERPIYRPGQPVYFKGIVRQDNDLDYSLPDQSQVKVKISNYKETVYESDLSLSEFGSFDGELTLDGEAILGYYTLEAYLPGKDQSIGSVTFNVAEYRKPEFQVKVSAKPENVLAGESFNAEAQADYYSGGGVAEAEVNWTLTSEPFYFTPSEDLSAYSFTDIEEDIYKPDEYEETGSEIVAEGSGTTNNDGYFTVDIQADLSKWKTSRQLTFEATLTDISKNAVSGRAQIVAHRSMVYPGVKPRSYVGIAGDEETFDVVVLDWEGKSLPGQELSVEIVERKWYSVQEQDASGRVQWTSTVEEIPAASFDDLVADDKGQVTVTFTPTNGGIFRAKATARDEKGNLGRASAYLWVAGEDYIPWRQTDDRSFDLVTDKKNYTPGDTAEILIASPFQGEAYALVTVERGRIRRQEVILLTSNSTVYRLPVTSDLAPNAYLSVLVVKGVDDHNPRPNFKMGIVELHVNTEQQSLQVEIIPNRSSVGPGEQVTYDVRTHDYQGEPVSAEVSLGLSDLATLSLMPPNSPPILEYFFSRRILGVWTSMPIGLSIDEYNANIKEHLPEGTKMGSGGGKGEGDLGVVEVRQDFPDTAFWDAYVVTDRNGKATVTVTLPDNLTTWRMDARAVTPDTLVGQSTQDIVSSKPLLVRPQTPRFFVVNDQVRLGAAVQNNTQQALVVKVSLDSQGLTLQDPQDQKFEIEAGKQAYVSWEATVDPEALRVDLVFSAESGEHRDASRPPQGTLDKQGIPVYRYEARETVGASGQLTAQGTKVETIYLPKSLQVSEGELTIKASPSLAAGMTDGLSYLEHFPYECVEQTISRFLPNVLSTRAMVTAGISDPELESGLQTQVNTALQRLYNWQNADGGWGWWKGDESDPLTSAYVLLGMVEARDADYSVSDEVLERGLNYLRTQVVSILGLTDPGKVNRQAFILYVLALAGQPDVSSTIQLYEQHQRMALYSRSFLARTLFTIDNEDPRLDTLLSDITNAAIVSATGTHWEEKEIDRWNWNTDTRTTAIVLSTLSLLDPGNPLNANAVRWLMSNRSGGHWRSTQETAWTLMALTNWMVESGELQANYKYAVALNGKRLGGGVANSETLRRSLELKVDLIDMLRDQTNQLAESTQPAEIARLAFAHDEGSGNLYYTAHLDVSLPVEQTKALDQGIVVSRGYYRLDDLNTPVTEAKQGELLLARITIVAPGALHYLVIDDPLPAGLEALDQSLSTSPKSVEVPQVYSWEDIFWRGWGWWFFRHIQLRDEKVVLSTNFLPAGTYIYTYLVRASTIGIFSTIPTTAQEFYFPEVYGRGEGSLFTVNP